MIGDLKRKKKIDEHTSGIVFKLFYFNVKIWNCWISNLCQY